MRTALLRFVGHAGLTGEVRWAISRLNAPARDESRAAAESVTRLAPATMDVILEAVNSGSRRQRRALVPILRTIAVADQTLATLVASELDVARRARSLARALASGPVSPLVLQRLGERVEEALSSILALLAAREEEPRLAELGSLLERVRDARDRAALLEAVSLNAGRGERAAPRPPRRPGDGVGRERRGESHCAPARLRRGGARGPRGRGWAHPALP